MCRLSSPPKANSPTQYRRSWNGGFLTFLALIVAAVFLFKSLNKQIKRVDFPESGDPDAPAERTPEGRTTS